MASVIAAALIAGFGLFLAITAPARMLLRVTPEGNVVGFANYANSVTWSFVSLGIGTAIFAIATIALLAQPDNTATTTQDSQGDNTHGGGGHHA